MIVDEGEGKAGWIILRQSVREGFLVLDIESEISGGERNPACSALAMPCMCSAAVSLHSLFNQHCECHQCALALPAERAVQELPLASLAIPVGLGPGLTLGLWKLHRGCKARAVSI